MKFLTYIAILCLSLLVQGCSLAILGEDFEPTDLSSLKVGASREEVESLLGKPVSNVPDKIENIAVYSYDKGASNVQLMDARGYVQCWALLFILCEPILTPIALSKRQKKHKLQQGKIGIHYGASGIAMVVVFDRYGLRSSFWETLSRAVCGDSDAQYRIGDAFESGRGVRVSDVEAYKWYTVSASGGNRLSALVNELLVEKMSVDQITEAERLVAEWKPNPAECEMAASPGS